MSGITKIVGFVKEWVLIFAILAGILGYFVYAAIPALTPTRHMAVEVAELLQPLLIFAMLFLSFSNINPRDIKLRPWHLWLLAFQAALFVGLGAVAARMHPSGWKIVVESAMICFICPVASASVVITRKIGGSASGITTYTILINLVAALLIPIVVPFVETSVAAPAAAGRIAQFASAAVQILGKVFPLLLLPLILAFIVRSMLPKVHHQLTHLSDFPFYLWVVTLIISTAITTRFLVSSHISAATTMWLIAVTLLSCVMQFWVGWRIGAIYGDRITAGQALGQKNTVLAIWLGYTFFNPVTSVAGGFYLLFHNLINSYQLHRHHAR